MSLALDQLLAMHTRKILHYKRLLERAQASAAAQLHALQAEVQLLRDQATNPEGCPAQHPQPRDPEAFCFCGARKRKGFWSGYQGDEDDQSDSHADIVKALCGNGQGSFNEKEIKHTLRRFGQDDRMRLIAAILECQ